MKLWLITLIFFSNILDDVLVVLYIRRCASGKYVSASVLSGLITGVVAFSVILYTDNHWYLIPTIIGSVIGTYIAVKFDAKKGR